MRGATSDPARREELDRALEELDSARAELRDAGREVLRAKREAVDTAREAARDAATAIEEARRSAEEALKDAGVENTKVREALEQSLKSAKEAEEEAKKALARDRQRARAPKRIVIDVGPGKDRALVDIDPARPAPGEKPRVEVLKFGSGGKGPSGSITIDLDDATKGASPKPPEPPTPPAIGGVHIGGPGGVVVAPLPPELRAQIRQNVSGDLKKIGIGAALVLIFIPLFILTAIAKFFIDRSRAAQRMADLKRKEAEYHRMSQQVTEAKLQALQAQVEPHFLYNTLANVQALTEVDPARAHTMVGHLIQYLRNALPKMRESISTVGQEVELVRAYLNILQMRMGKRLSFEISVPESLLATPFPPLMLPSLVENAIKHGLEPQREGGAVLISAQAQDGKLRLTVSDTGRGLRRHRRRGRGARQHPRAAGRALRREGEAHAGVELAHGRHRHHRGAAGGTQAAGRDAAGRHGRLRRRCRARPAGRAEDAGRQGDRRGRQGRAHLAEDACRSPSWPWWWWPPCWPASRVFAVLTGAMPVQVGSETLTGPGGALLGAAGIVIAFAAIVLVLGILAAIVYGLGWLFLALAIFIPVVVLIALSPALAPVALLGLFGWWLFRKTKVPEPAPAPRPKVEPVMQPAPPPAPAAPAPPSTPPPLPREEPPAG